MRHYKPTLQTSFDEKGNCLAACIATLFNIDIDVVPFFDNNDTWITDLSKWLGANYGMFAFTINLPAKHYKLLNGSLIITSIYSPNPRVDRHAVIVKDGKIVFDPMVGEVNERLYSANDPVFLIISEIHTK